ncbi:MAG: SCO family protein [Gammaproteobacteria bacterium]|nr:SCO family protein [Gammaproteobacteria bacterium]NIR83827.1 SCO family protein [Gammaproteobacteria bacterium]NIV73434.1 SCO family protein [Gammaproteobacteria bacterium]
MSRMIPRHRIAMRGLLVLAGGLTAVMLTLGAVAADPAGHSASGAARGEGRHRPSPAFDRKQAMARSQAAIGQVLGDHVLRDRTGQQVHLADFRGRPLVVSLIYTSCFHICPRTTRHLAKVVRTARDALGEDSFAVATLGFDVAVDTPAAMREFAKRQRVDISDWYFLSADEATIGALAEDLGFTYVRSPKGFDHVVQASVIDARGRVYRQVYGQEFETPLLVEPLKELVFGRRTPPQTAGHLWDRLLFYCTTYDPASGAYRFDYSLFIGLAIGLIILASTTTYLVREVRRRG